MSKFTKWLFEQWEKAEFPEDERGNVKVDIKHENKRINPENQSGIVEGTEINQVRSEG